MPKTDIHIEASVRKTGNGHPETHAFVDFESKKPERHDITRMVDHSRLLEKKYGTEAVQEFVQHIHDDVQCKFRDFIQTLKTRSKDLSAGSGPNDSIERKFDTLVSEAETKLKGILGYFGKAHPRRTDGGRGQGTRAARQGLPA